jgi:hypothetical protein
VSDSTMKLIWVLLLGLLLGGMGATVANKSNVEKCVEAFIKRAEGHNTKTADTEFNAWVACFRVSTRTSDRID